MKTLEQRILQGADSNTKTFIYDGSFNGFLTAVFIGFEQKILNAHIQANSSTQNGLFAQTQTIFTNIGLAKRVWNGIKNRSNAAIKNVYFAFLSEQKGIEPLLYRYIQKLMGSHENDTSDISTDCILKINQLSHKVGREKQRMEASVNFKLTNDDILFAQIEPGFDVLPLISKHFRARYANQEWMIYDAKRSYGLYYDLQGVEVIGLELQDNFTDAVEQKAASATGHFEYQEMWDNYVRHSNIKSHITKKLHTQHFPKRSDKYLSEKKEAV